MQHIFLDVLPVLRRYDMAERMKIVVADHFRLARRPGREVYEHGVAVFCRLVSHRSLKGLGHVENGLCEVYPALALAVYEDKLFERRALGARSLGLRHNEIVVYADHRFD